MPRPPRPLWFSQIQNGLFIRNHLTQIVLKNAVKRVFCCLFVANKGMCVLRRKMINWGWDIVAVGKFYACLENVQRCIPEARQSGLHRLPHIRIRWVSDLSVDFSSRPPDARGLCFAQYVFFFFIYLLVYAVKVAGTVVHLGFFVLRREVTQAAAGGCRANNVR